MKFEIEMDCTPEEARKFFGLPDVGPLQDQMMRQIQEKMMENIRHMSPEDLAKTWIPMTMQGFSDMQKMFWTQFKDSMAGAQAPAGGMPMPGMDMMTDPLSTMAGMGTGAPRSKGRKTKTSDDE
jgi:hypothetical protein